MTTFAFIYAHPDDGSFGIAGTAMKLEAAGHGNEYFHLAIDHGTATARAGLLG